MDVLVHGFNVDDPYETVGRLEFHVKNPFLFDYGHFNLFNVLFNNKREGKKLKKVLDDNPRSTVYAHSNGAAISVIAASLGAKIKTLVCINPALKCNTVFPKSIENIIIIHTENDRPTETARFLDKVPLVQLLVPNAWGAMGARGASIDDERLYNWDLSYCLEGHSDFFTDENLNELMPILTKML